MNSLKKWLQKNALISSVLHFDMVILANDSFAVKNISLELSK